MATDLRVKMGKNEFPVPGGEQVLTVDSGDEVDLVAVDHANAGARVAGEWTLRPSSSPGDLKSLADSSEHWWFTAKSEDAGAYIFTPHGANAAPVSVRVAVEEKRIPAWLRRAPLGTVGVLIAFGLYAAIWALVTGVGWGAEGRTGNDAIRRSTILAVVTLLMFGALVEIAGRVSTKTSGLTSLVSGKDRRASTSKIQLLLWTLLIGGILAFIAAYSAMDSSGGKTFQCTKDYTTFCVPEEPDDWAPFLVLLGVPAAAAVTAKGIVAYKVVNGTLQKSEAEETKSAQVVSNDNGEADLVDVQYLLFNLIAFAYVFGLFLYQHELKPVPDLLLGLTSTAAATYVLNKALATNKPTITAVTPSAIKPGDMVYITGENLLVAGSDGKVPSSLEAKVAGIRATAHPEPGASSGAQSQRLMVMAPVGLTGTETAPVITVITGANVEAEGFPITVTVVPLAIVGWAGSPPNIKRRPARNAVLVTTGLPRAIDVVDEASKKVQVTLNGQALTGTLNDVGNVVIDIIPAGATAVSPTTVKLTYQGKASEPVNLSVGV